MKKLHVLFIVAYVVIAVLSAWSLYLESFRDTWILGIIILIALVLSFFSHIKLLINSEKVKGEKAFLWLTVITILLPILGILFINQVMTCGGFGLGCMLMFMAVLGGSGLLWIVTIIVGLITALKKKGQIPTQVI